MKLSIRALCVVGALCVPALAVGQPQGSLDPGQEGKKEKVAGAADVPPEAQEAAAVLTKYLDAVKAKKWAEAKKHIHPKTLTAISERKKRLGDEDHPMAAWFYEKTQSYMKNYKIEGAVPGPLGTWVFETSEDNFQVQEKGMAEGEMATYLVGKAGGKWTVVDKKRGVTFTDDSVKFGYKGYFDKVEEAKKGEEE